MACLKLKVFLPAWVHRPTARPTAAAAGLLDQVYNIVFRAAVPAAPAAATVFPERAKKKARPRTLLWRPSVQGGMVSFHGLPNSSLFTVLAWHSKLPPLNKNQQNLRRLMVALRSVSFPSVADFKPRFLLPLFVRVRMFCTPGGPHSPKQRGVFSARNSLQFCTRQGLLSQEKLGSSSPIVVGGPH